MSEEYNFRVNIRLSSLIVISLLNLFLHIHHHTISGIVFYDFVIIFSNKLTILFLQKLVRVGEGW